MNYEGLQPFPVKRFGGSADYDDPTLIPWGLATVVRNARFRKSSVRTRDGSVHTMSYSPLTGDVTGFDVLQVLGDNPQQVGVVMTDQGVLLRETPAGSGTLVPINTPFVLPTGASMQTAKAYNEIHMAMSDLKTPLLPPMALDGRTGITRPVSQNIVGALWGKDRNYVVGDLVRSPDRRWWRCFSPTTGLVSDAAPLWPAVNGQFVGSPLTGVTAAEVVVNWSNTPAPFAAGPWYVYVVNATKGSQFLGPFSVSTFSNGSHSTYFLETFQVGIPADPGLTTWTIYIGTSPTLAAMTKKFTVVGTAAAQVFTAQTAPAVTAAPGAPSGVWLPSTTTDGNGAQWEEWTPNCTNKLPAPDVLNTATSITHNPGGGTIAGAQDVYVELTFTIGNGESPRSAPLVFVNTSANDQIIVAFGNNGGVRLPRWIAELNIQSFFFQGVSLNVYVASVATGATAPMDSAYSAYATNQSIGASVVISSIAAPAAPLSPSAAAGNYANPANAYDGNLTTYSAGTAGGSGNPSNASEVWSGFGAGLAANNILNIKTQVSIPQTGGVAGGAQLEYSLDSGVSWTFVYNVRALLPIKTYAIALPNGQDFTHIQVRATTLTFYPPPPSASVQSVYEIYITSGAAPIPPSGGTCYIASTYPNAPTLYLGETGARYMAVLRADAVASLSPVDPDSPISIQFQGQSVANIITINRDTAGNVQATVDDVSNLAAGQTLNVQGCLGVATLNGTALVTSVKTTLEPQGIVTWVSTVTGVAASDFTGSLQLPPQPPPFAFLPTAGTTTEEYVAAFTVVGAQKAGPFFYISEAVPTPAFTVPAISMQGTSQVQQAITIVSRYAGGYTQCQLPDITGIAPGQIVLVQATAGFPGMEGQFTIAAVEPIAGGKTGFIYWSSSATGALGPCAAGTVTIFIGTEGALQVVVYDASQLRPGMQVNIVNPVSSQFNGLATIASVKNNVVTLAFAAGGSASGGSLSVVQVLPTIAPAQSAQISSISRDASGNVVAEVDDVGGYTAGELIGVAGVTDASFDGLFEVVDTLVNNDGISGSILWQQTGTQVASTAGSIFGCSDPIINFDDNSLSSSVDNDVTAQLTAIPAPKSVDIFYSPSLDMMIYTTGKDSDHYFSDQGDPGNIQNPGGILGVDRQNGEKTVCFREMVNGELLSLKENGGYAITPGPVSANKFGVSRRWDRHGPCGARAVAVGADFLVFFDENSGLYRYHDGVLTAVGLEKQGTWDRLNKNAKEQVWIEVDDDRNELHIGLPLDGATVPNIEMTLNYFNGWDEPLMLTLSGEEIPSNHGRRWAEGDRKARLGKLLSRDLTVSVDPRIDEQQMLYGMESDGTNNIYVDMTVPDRFNDNGVGIDFRYRLAFVSSPTLEELKFIALKGRALGAGLMNILALTNDSESNLKVRTVQLDNAGGDAVRFARGVGDLVNELFTVELNNGAVPDAWCELQALVLYGKVATAGRVG